MSVDPSKLMSENAAVDVIHPKDNTSTNHHIPGVSNRNIENMLLSALLLILGIVIMIQIREGISIQQKYTSEKENYTLYQKQLSDLKSENAQLKSDNSVLSEQKDLLTESVLTEQGYPELAVALSDARRLAGLTNITGEGVTVTMNDSSITDSSDINQYSLIHSQDVQYVVDLLKSSGAEAICINGERIVCTTSITCTGPTIRVNNGRYPVPFIISAVCDPESTYDILQSDAYIQYRKTNSVEIDLEIDRNLMIPAYSDLSAVDLLSEELEAEAIS